MANPAALLAIETSHSQGSVALGSLDPDSGSTPTEEQFPPGLVHGREILVCIDRIFKRRGCDRGDLRGIAVSVGPGSYTGMRVGVAAAKALGFACQARVLGISTLETIACNVEQDGEFAVILDARRNACYGARFERRGDELIRLDQDRVVPPAEFLAELAPGTPLVGEGAAQLPGCDAFPTYPPQWNLPRAGCVFTLGRRWWQAIQVGARPEPDEYQNPHRLVPSYLRRSEAEEQLAARMARGDD